MGEARFSSIGEALSGPVSEVFWVSLVGSKVQTGHPDSFYAKMVPGEHLTFDVSNNKVLANLSANGTIQHLTTYRGCYPRDDRMRGVWWHKDFSQSGPLSYAIQLGQRRWDLAEVDWPVKMSLLGGVFPMAHLTGPGLQVKLLAYAPISQQGQRVPAVIYGLWLDNTSQGQITGTVLLPVGDENTYVAAADGVEYAGGVAFDLAPGQSMWVPGVISPPPGEKAMAQVNRRTSLEWLNETLAYFKRMTGELTMEDDPFLADFFGRTLLQCFNSIGMTPAGEVVGANWSGYPATKHTWMKDMYYSYMPFARHEPRLLTTGILWFLNRSVRFKGDTVYHGYTSDGSVSYSLSNTLTPVVLSGMYYSATGDKEFFKARPEVVDRIGELLEEVCATRAGAPCLFPSMWLSDGPSRGDYHTGSNVVAWLAFKSAADIYEEVVGDVKRAARYRSIAGEIKRDIDRLCIADGPMGAQYVEGANESAAPEQDHDGEETDTTLMPFYGFTRYDDPNYQHHVRVAVTEANRHYRATTRGIRDSTWIEEPDPPIDATFTGYITGLAGATTAEEMNGPEGRLTILRRLVDLDGSVWWWPYRGVEVGRAYEINKGIVGKSGWASSVFAAHFVSQILGVSYDGRARTLKLRPLSPTSDYTWKRFRMGGGVFSVEFSRSRRSVACRVENHNDFEVTVELELILARDAKLTWLRIDGQVPKDGAGKGRFFDVATAKISLVLPGGEARKVEAGY